MSEGITKPAKLTKAQIAILQTIGAHQDRTRERFFFGLSGASQIKCAKRLRAMGYLRGGGVRDFAFAITDGGRAAAIANGAVMSARGEF